MKSYQEFEINYFQDEDGMFTATVPAIRGCVAWGKTLPECYRNAVDAIESCLEARKKVMAKKPRKSRYAGLNILPKGTLRTIVREMGITVEQFNDL